MSEDPDQPTWAANTGLAEETARAMTYPPQSVKETWEQEADDQGFPSLSQYIYQLVEEARAYRQHDLHSPNHAERQIQQLQTEVERLQSQLEQERRKQGGRPEIDDIDFLEKYLTTNYQSLEDLLQSIVESGALNDLIRKRVEDQLYYLLAQDRVQYERGWGWKLTDGSDGNGGDR